MLAFSAKKKTRMSLAELIYEEVKSPAGPAAREVLDFCVGYSRPPELRGLARSAAAQAHSLESVWNNNEDPSR